MTWFRFLALLLDPSHLARALARRLPGIPFRWRMQLDLIERPQYAYGIYRSALQAKLLRLPAVSALELGVAGGNGLVYMEHLAAKVEGLTGIEIATFGFDSGEGMPEPQDYRDLPYVWQPGYYAMDRVALETRLGQSELVIGDIKDTVDPFLQRETAPMGFLAFDLDYYSSTVDALRILEGGDFSRYLPRVLCYFDDTIGEPNADHCEDVGELLAIREFNEQHADRKIRKIHGLHYKRRFPSAWNEQMYVCHMFTHPAYCTHLPGITFALTENSSQNLY